MLRNPIFIQYIACIEFEVEYEARTAFDIASTAELVKTGNAVTQGKREIINTIEQGIAQAANAVKQSQ